MSAVDLPRLLIRPTRPHNPKESLAFLGGTGRVGFNLFRRVPTSGQNGRTGMKGILARNANIDLGLAILASTSEPPHTCKTIAAYCGCSRQAIQQIEQKALRKFRAALYRDRILREAFENEFQGLSKK